MKTLLTLISAACIGGTVLAEPGSQTTTPATKKVAVEVVAEVVLAERELIQLENDWAKAYLARDVKALDQIAAEGWAFTGADGDVYSKAEDLADVASGAFVATVFEMADVKVKIFGDTAVVTGRQTVRATYKGKDASAVYRITDVWQRRDGRWQAISSHLSRPAPVVAPTGSLTSILFR